MHELKHDFTHRKISPWGGIKLFQRTVTRSGIRDFISRLGGLPQPGSNRGYATIDLIEGFLTSVVLGASRLDHCGMLRTDQVVKEIYGWRKGMASASTFQRFFHKFDDKINRKVFPAIILFIFYKVMPWFTLTNLEAYLLQTMIN